MKNTDKENDFDKGKSQLNNYARYSGLAFQMIAIIGFFAFIGYKIDLWLENKVQWVTAISCIFGIGISLYQVIRQLNK